MTDALMLLKPRGWSRSALTLALLLGLAAPMAHAARPAGAAEAPHLQALLDCRLWIASLDRCLSAPAVAGLSVPPEFPAQYRPLAPDHRGIRRDTYYFLGLQLSVIATLYVMPESMSGWSDEQKNQHHLSKWWNNVSNPDWDDDKDYINYVLHPYWGAAYYVRARERGFGPSGAFWYSVLLSTLYEAGVEAFFEPLSIQDFFVTPIAGSLLGHQFMKWRNATRTAMVRTGEVRLRDRLLLVATDPLGNAADLVDRRLGRSVEFRAAPYVASAPTHGWGGAGSPPGGRASVYGITVNLRW